MFFIDMYILYIFLFYFEEESDSYQSKKDSSQHSINGM